MEKWHGLLAKVLDKLVESAEGKNCIEFWDRIISNLPGASGSGPHINGWASVFCCFDSKGKWIGKDAVFWDKNRDWPFVD